MDAQSINQFAKMRWNPRWNNAGQIVYCEENGRDLYMVNCMGSMELKREDKNTVAFHLRRAAEMLERLPE